MTFNFGPIIDRTLNRKQRDFFPVFLEETAGKLYSMAYYWVGIKRHISVKVHEASNYVNNNSAWFQTRAGPATGNQVELVRDHDGCAQCLSVFHLYGKTGTNFPLIIVKFSSALLSYGKNRYEFYAKWNSELKPCPFWMENPLFRWEIKWNGPGNFERQNAHFIKEYGTSVIKQIMHSDIPVKT